MVGSEAYLQDAMLAVIGGEFAEGFVLDAVDGDALLEPFPQLALFVAPDLVVGDVALVGVPVVWSGGAWGCAAEEPRVDQQCSEEGDEDLWCE